MISFEFERPNGGCQLGDRTGTPRVAREGTTWR